MARCAGSHLMDGTLRHLPEDPRPPRRSGVCFVRTLSVRTLRHHLEIVVLRTAADETHSASVERRWRAERYPADGHGKSPRRRTYGTDEHDLCGDLARGQCWLF